MTGAQQIAAEISSRLADLRAGTPVVFGDIFGGLIVEERELVIKDADRVRWEWGAPQGAAGDRPRLHIEHVRHGAQVEVTRSFLGRDDTRRVQPTRRT